MSGRLANNARDAIGLVAGFVPGAAPGPLVMAVHIFQEGFR